MTEPPDVSVERLRDLINHMYIHAGYRDNGYDEMSRQQRDLYLYVTGREKTCECCGQVVAYAEDEKVKP